MQAVLAREAPGGAVREAAQEEVVVASEAGQGALEAPGAVGAAQALQVVARKPRSRSTR